MSLIATARLILRPFDAGDAEELYRLVYADPDVRDAWSDYRETLEQFRRRFAEGNVWRVLDRPASRPECKLPMSLAERRFLLICYAERPLRD
jgi:RimJ/RimL family protein N-acetyltransferase